MTEVESAALSWLKDTLIPTAWAVRFRDDPGDGPVSDTLQVGAMSHEAFREYTMSLEEAARGYLALPVSERSLYYVDTHGDAMAVFAEAARRDFLTEKELSALGQNPPMQMVANWLAVVSSNVARNTGHVLDPSQRFKP